MGRRHFIKNGYKRILALTVLAALQLPAAFAFAEAPPLDRDKLMGLARQFVEKVGQDLKTADAHMAEKIDPEDLRMQEYFKGLPEGEPLVLQISLSGTRFHDKRKLSIDQPVMAIKEGNDVMISLLDFVSAASFPIKVDAEKGIADGWFIRESQPFHLDMTARKVTALDKIFDIAPDDARIDGSDILVRGKTISRWFGFQMLTDPQSQKLEVMAKQPWPLQEKMDRVRRYANIAQKQPPKNPRQDEEYKIVGTPKADISLRQLYDKDSSGQVRKVSAWSLNGTGDLAAHQARATFSGSDQEMINTINFSLSRSSDEPSLLGPLKARFYELNDIRSVKVPLTGNAPLERGVHVTNRNPDTTYDTTTVIDGYTNPEWDVELYRDTQYITAMTVGIDGRYGFEDVPLFAGENKFRIVHYGPHGEVREEERVMTVAPGAYGTAGLYNVSLSQQKIQTYTAAKSGGRDEGTPHLAATYEKQIGDTLVVHGGINARQQQGTQALYLNGGAFTQVGKTIVNTDVAVTPEKTYTGSLVARRSFGVHSGSASLNIRSEDYVIDTAIDTPAPANYSTTATLSGPLTDMLRGGPTYTAFAGMSLTGTDTTTLSTGLKLSGKINKNIYASNSLSYSQVTNAAGESLEKLGGDLSLRGRAVGTTWRSSLDYNLMPEAELKNLRLNFSRKLTKKMGADVNFLRKMDTGYTQKGLALDWDLDYATLSSSVSHDSEQAISATMNVRFGLAYNPYSNDIIMKSSGLSSTGGIAAFVFLDRDGDGTFTAGDEPLPDVLVKAAHVSRTADTDEKGEAFIYDLPTNTVTDIIVEESSTFDPTWVSGFPGISLRPRAGSITRIDFPILQGAEMDGTAWMEDENGSKTAARNVRLVLNTPDGQVIKEALTPYDGFFVISGIRPGVYYLTADTELSPVTGYLPPKKVVIGPEGALLYGQNLVLTKGYNIPVTFRSDTPSPASDVRASHILRPTDIAAENVTFRIGQYHSRLGMAFDWYKLKVRHRDLGKYFTLATDFDAIAPDADSARLSLPLKSRNPLRPEEAAAICKQFIDRDFKCAIEVTTRFRDAVPVAETLEKPEKSHKG